MFSAITFEGGNFKRAVAGFLNIFCFHKKRNEENCGKKMAKEM